MYETEKEKNDEEFELSDCIEHDKKYFFAHLAKISCKLCSFRGKFIVEHYRASHPESEVLISRINPDVAEILIEDAVQNCEEYDKDNSELEKVTCNFKCPFCLTLVKATANTYYNHISSHTGEYCFRCDHCSYWTYSHANIRSHLNQIHHDIQKTRYKMVHLDPKISKYVFGYICSECNFTQLVRTTVEEHVMIYHPGIPEIHRVNLGMLLQDNVLDGNCVNETHSNENAVTSGSVETHNHNLKIPTETKELSNFLAELEELEEIKVKIEPKELDDDPHSIEFTTFICQPDLDIKQDSESDRLEMSQIKLVTEIVDETEKIQGDNKEPNNIEKLNEELNPPKQLEKARKLVEMIEIGPISVIKEFDVFMFHCKIQNCNYFSKDNRAFAIHCEIIHKDFSYIVSTGECNICSIKFEHRGKFVTVYDVYLHIITIHKDFFEPKSLIREDKEEALSSDLTSKLKQLLSTSETDSKCASLLTDIPMSDIEKQNRKCPKAVAAMMRSPLLNALYKCPQYDCSFATMLPLYFQAHFVTHHSILMDTLVPCLYCDFKVFCNSYVIHLKVRHGHCLFGCGDCFYRTTNSYFVMMHRELTHPNTEFNILQLEVVTSNRISADTTPANLSELVPPYNCEDDGFLSCPFKTLYFDEYVKHVEAIHQVNEFGLFLSGHELQKEVIMEGWLAKEVGPFQCSYCKKATVTHQEMGRHQAVFHAHEQCLFYYRKFVSNDAVIIPEQVNLEEPSFINHVIHLPDQIHLCDFKLMDGLLSSTSTKINGESEVSFSFLQPPMKDAETELNKSNILLDETEALSALVKDEASLFDELDPLCLDKEPKDDDVVNDTTFQCKWTGCYQTYHFQAALVKHIKKNHIWFEKGEEFTCFWINCPKKSKHFASKQDLLRHMRIHSGEKLHKCLFQGCNKAFSQLATLQAHQRSHTGEKPYLCQFPNCLKSFSSGSNRNQHQRMHYCNTETYTCQVNGCSKKYTKRSSLWRHMKSHTVEEQLVSKREPIEKEQKVDDFMLKKSSNSLDGVKHQRTHCGTLQCKWKDCYQTYESQMALVNHIKKNHIRLQRGKKFTCFWIDCPRNSKPFSIKYRLLMHMRIHSGEKPHKCLFQGCNKAFSHLVSLQAHQRLHTGERPYLCQFPNCSKSFARSSNRNKHQKMHYYTEAYAYQFTDSSKKDADMSTLQKHMENQTIDEQFDTKLKSVENEETEDHYILEKSSNCSDGDKHLKAHSDTISFTVSLMLQCKWKDCSQTYESQMALINHIKKNHVRLQGGEVFTCFWIDCSRNSKPFPTKYDLSRHMRIHSGEKPHKCPFQGCNKAFSQLGTLYTHQRSHTGEKPYLCQFPNCLKSFCSGFYRNKHQRTHYKAETYACQVTGCSKKYAKRKPVEKEQKMDDFMLKKSSNSLDVVKQQRTHCDTLQCKWKDCSQKYESQMALINHIKKNHLRLQGGKVFTCFWIGCPRNSKPFAAKCDLSRHMRIHSGEKPHKCTFQGCNKAFSQLAILYTHQRTHTGEKPYLCQFPNCLKSFSTGASRNKHQRKHHDAKCYACQVTNCSKKFVKMSNLQKHSEQHTIDKKLEVKQKGNDFIIYHI